MDISTLVKAQRSLFGSKCEICEKPVVTGDKILAAEKKIGIGIIAKTLRYEAHVSCVTGALDVLAKKVVEAERL
jgi:hypothetical protein